MHCKEDPYVVLQEWQHREALKMIDRGEIK